MHSLPSRRDSYDLQLRAVVYSGLIELPWPQRDFVQLDQDRLAGQPEFLKEVGDAEGRVELFVRFAVERDLHAVGVGVDSGGSVVAAVGSLTRVARRSMEPRSRWQSMTAWAAPA